MNKKSNNWIYDFYLVKLECHSISEMPYINLEIREIIQEIINKIFKNKKVYISYFKEYFNTNSINNILNSYEEKKRIYLEIDYIDINKVYENFDKWASVHVYENNVLFDDFKKRRSHKKGFTDSMIFEIYFDRDFELVTLNFYKPTWNYYQLFKDTLEKKGYYFKIDNR